MKTIIKCSIGIAVLTLASGARATPRPLPFTYPYETLDEGQLELELYGDVTPLRVDTDQGRIWEPSYALQNEFEYGINDRFELGFYQVFEGVPNQFGSNDMTFDGFKWRIRTRLAEAGEWPVDVGLYLELETMHDELALEEKVILAKRVGRWHWMANLWVEESESRPLDPQERSFHFIINPTTGLVYQFTPGFQVGIEYWARGELEANDINDQVHHFLGPTMHIDFGKLWWSLGAYADLTNLHTPQPGDVYGPCWVRTVLGLNL